MQKLFKKFISRFSLMVSIFFNILILFQIVYVINVAQHNVTTSLAYASVHQMWLVRNVTPVLLITMDLTLAG